MSIMQIGFSNPPISTDKDAGKSSAF